MKTQTEAQWKQILAYMKTGRTITAYQALTKFNCLNLKGRINDIRMKGHNINTDMREISNGKIIAYYSYVD